MRADADGSDDRAGGRFDGLRLLDNVFESGVEVGLTPGDEAGGMSVAVNRGVVGEAEFVDDTVAVAPAEEGVFEVFAVRAAADGALASVAGGGFLFLRSAGPGQYIVAPLQIRCMDGKDPMRRLHL